MRHFYLIYFLIICCSQHVFSGQIHSSLDFTPFIHEYRGHYTYEGDLNGDFKGDYAVILDDGSSWKVHSNDCEQLTSWNIGDKVHVEFELRDSWVFFKAHKFILFNHQKNQGLYVMLIDTPLVVDFSGVPNPTVRTKNWPLPHIYGDYKQNLILSDHSTWEVDSYAKDTRFSKNTPAYVGYNVSHEDYLDPKRTWGSFFIILGKGKGAKWEWAQTGNYTHYFADRVP